MHRPGLLLTAASLGFALLLPAQNAVAASDADQFKAALYKFMPVMRFDDGSLPFVDDGEHFFPLRVTAIANNPGNQLQRANGAVLAERHADGTGLTIGYLRGIPPGVYPHINDAILDTDVIDERSNDLDTYKADAKRFQTDPHYRNRIYGHIVPHYERGFLAGAWLQYWFFYYYNDFPGTDVGDHEGDWEMIQLFVDVDHKPQVAVYSQHNGHTYCFWDRVPKSNSRPVVFVARGSHASYFHDGHHGQDLFVDGDNTVPMRLIRVGSTSPRWINWPGFWGASGGILGEFHSPRGPKFHGAFLQPQAFYESADLDNDCN
jgi:hypothetical protein